MTGSCGVTVTETFIQSQYNPEYTVNKQNKTTKMLTKEPYFLFSNICPVDISLVLDLFRR